jgi:hypothetical protein
MQIDWSDCKTVLIPRQHLLKKLDPSGLLNVPQLCEKLRPLVSDFERLVLKDVAQPGLDISRALEIYLNFNLIRFVSEWTENEIPVSCSIITCLSNCACSCTLLFGDSVAECSGQLFMSQRIILLLQCLSWRPAGLSEVQLAGKG